MNVKSDLSKNQWDFSIDCDEVLNCYIVPRGSAKLDIRWYYTFLLLASCYKISTSPLFIE